MRIAIGMIPQENINTYNLLPLVKNGHIVVKIWKGIYDLPKASEIPLD